MFKNIIFDWSGVIKDCNDELEWVVNKMINTFGGKEMTFEEIRQNWEQPYMKFWNKYYPDLTLEEEQKVYLGAILDKDCPPAVSYSGIEELIHKLRGKGMSMAILSSDHHDTIFPEIKKFGLEGVFVETVAHVHDKSDEIEGLIKRNNFDKEATVFIGDSNHEVEAGKKAGIKTIAVTWGFFTEERLKAKNPDYLVHNIKELEEILIN
jgi:HAD superfamily hydrolase (TIGR01509 family)